MRLPKRNRSGSRQPRSEKEHDPDREARATRITAPLAKLRVAARELLQTAPETGQKRLAPAAASLRRRLSGARRRLAAAAASLQRRLAGPLGRSSRLLTPVRGILVAAVGCALLLLLSQFADYRGVAIGLDDFDPSVASAAPTPELEREEMGSAHGYAMVPVALVAIAILAAAVRSGRWQLCRLVALIGAAVIAVSFLIDRPIGLDEGTLARDFAAAEAQLLGGFWAQLFAGVGLLATALLLGREIRGRRPKAGERREIDRTAAGVSRTRAQRRLNPAGYQR